MTEGDEMAMQSQWIDLLRFEKEQRMLETAQENRNVRSDVSPPSNARTGDGK